MQGLVNVKIGDNEWEKLQVRAFENKLTYGENTLEVNHKSVKLQKGETEQGHDLITINHQEADITLSISCEKPIEFEKWLSSIMEAYFYDKGYCKKKEEKQFLKKYPFL